MITTSLSYFGWGLWPNKTKDLENQDLENKDQATPVLSEDIEQPKPIAKISEKKPKQDYIFEVATIKVGSFWKDDDDEDEGEDATSRVALSTKQHLAYAAGMLAMSVLSGYFYKAPIVGLGFAGGAMDLTKTWYAYSDKTPVLKNVARVAALLALITAIGLQYTLSTEQKEQTLLQVINALPLMYPGMGIFKAEVAKLQIDKQIVKLAAKCNLELSQSTAEIMARVMQILPALAISMTKFDKSLSAAGGIFFKTNVRKLSNMLGQYIYAMQNPVARRVAGSALAAASVASVVTGVVGNYFHWFSNSLGSVVNSLLLVPPADIVARTIKSTIKLSTKANKRRMQYADVLDQDKTCCQKATDKVKKLGEAAAFTLPILGTALAVGQMNLNSSNAGLVAALLGDAISFIKVATNKFPTNAVLAASAAGVMLGGSAYTVREFTSSAIDIPLYSTWLTLAALTGSFAIYQIKRLVRPPYPEES